MPIPNDGDNKLIKFQPIRMAIEDINEAILIENKEVPLSWSEFLRLRLEGFQGLIKIAKVFDFRQYMAATYVENLVQIMSHLVVCCDTSYRLETYAKFLYCCAELLIEAPEEPPVNSSTTDKKNVLLQAALSLKTVCDALSYYTEHISLDLEPYETMALNCLNAAEERCDATPCTESFASPDQRFLAVYKRFASYEWSEQFINEGFTRRVNELICKLSDCQQEQAMLETPQQTTIWGGLSRSLQGLISHISITSARSYQPVVDKVVSTDEPTLAPLPKQSNLPPSLNHRNPTAQGTQFSHSIT